MNTYFKTHVLRLFAMAAVAVALVPLPLAPAAAQAPAPAAKTILNVPFKGVTTPASTFDLVQSVTDFEPGAASHVITTGTPHYLSVLEGELTIDIDGQAEAVAAGKGISAPAGAKLVLRNDGSSNARLFASTLLGVGAVADVHQLSAAGLKPFAAARRTMVNAPAVVDVVQMSAVYDAGYRTPNHVMNEFHLMIHTSGQVGYAYLDGGAESYAAGTQAIMYEGRPGWMRNDGQGSSSMAWTWVGTPGKPLSSAVPAAAAPAPPNTGTGLRGPSSESDGAVLVASGLVMLTATALLLRLRRKERLGPGD
jgi:quercetin dioxygenase-like cupin family protein